MALLSSILLLASFGVAQQLRLDFQVTELESRPFQHNPHLRARNLEVPVYNALPKQIYLINMTAGTPPQPYSIIFDTGSGDLWLPDPNSPGCAPNPCPPGSFIPSDSSTAVDINLPYNASFGLNGDNAVLGKYYNDTISIGGVVLPNQTFAVVNVTKINFEANHWGIMGFSSRLATAAYIAPDSPVRGDPDKAPASVVWEHLYEAGYMEKKLFSVWLDDQDAKSGTVLLGGVDTSKYVGELKSVPVNLSGPKKLFTEWNVNLTSIAQVDGQTGKTKKLTNETWTTHTVVDTGAPILYLPTDIYSTIGALFNATINSTFNTPYVPCSFASSTSSLDFGFAGTEGKAGPKINVPYRELVYPFGLPASIGEVRGDDGTELCYFGVYPSPGPIYLIGATLIRNAYMVFDAENLQIGMAQVKKGGYNQSQR